MTNSVLFYANSNNFSCKSASVVGSMLEVASSKQIISVFRIIILKKLITYFSPFDKFAPDYSI